MALYYTNTCILAVKLSSQIIGGYLQFDRLTETSAKITHFQIQELISFSKKRASRASYQHQKHIHLCLQKNSIPGDQAGDLHDYESTAVPYECA